MRTTQRLGRVETDLLVRAAAQYLAAAGAVMEGDGQRGDQLRDSAAWLEARAKQVSARRRCTGVVGGVF